MNVTLSTHYTVRLLGTAFLSLALLSVGATKPADTVEKLAVADLAKRLGVPASTVEVVKKDKVVWPDSSLGLPRVNEVVAKGQVAGYQMTLKVDDLDYSYSASNKAVRFAGPSVLSALTILVTYPVKDEPNLNGNLYKASLMGANPKVVLKEVTRFGFQADGGILAVRRTSRSGHELLYLASAANKDFTKLADAFDFGAFTALSGASTWAAVVRPSVGAAWVVQAGGALTQNHVAATIPCPTEGVPSFLAFYNNKLYSRVKNSFFSWVDNETSGTWETVVAPHLPSLAPILLNKSQELQVVTEQESGKPVTKVQSVWFTGDKVVLARLPGFEVSSFTLLDLGWVVIFGHKEGKPTTMLVNIEKRHKLMCDLGNYMDAQIYRHPTATGK